MWICTGMRSTRLWRKRPGQRDGADQKGEGGTCAVTTPVNPNTEILMMLVTTEITASVAVRRRFNLRHQKRQDHAEPDVPPTDAVTTA